mmetsp:Transcript_5476/g.16327  ORF Transcript_5476/g.16327 Transcript_5476/m.16327 type:complete len:253 (-) Transcript_5476:300-1058(-)
MFHKEVIILDATSEYLMLSVSKPLASTKIIVDDHLEPANVACSVCVELSASTCICIPELCNIIHRYLRRICPRNLCANGMKYPRVSDSSSTDHERITSCGFEHFLCAFRACDVAVANDWYGDSLFGALDQAPVRPSCISLKFCTGMYRDGLCSSVNGSSHVLQEQICIVVAAPHLDRHFRGSGYHAAHDLCKHSWGSQQAGAATFAGDFLCRTAAVKVNTVRPSCHQQFSNFPHDLVFRPHNLWDERNGMNF